MALDASSTSKSIHIDPNPEFYYLTNAYQGIPKDISQLCNGNLGPFLHSECRNEVEEGLAMIDLMYTDKSKISALPEDKENVFYVTQLKNGEKNEEQSDAPRRNPVRKARNNSRIFYNSEEFYDECVFSDDEVLKKPENETNKKVVSFKEWPINVHERPEFNSVTKEIEQFDYTIRQISELYTKKASNKTTAKRTRKVKRYGPLKRRRRIVTEKRVPLRELKACVTETTTLLRNVAGKIKLDTNLEQIVVNQSILCTFVNDGRFVF